MNAQTQGTKDPAAAKKAAAEKKKLMALGACVLVGLLLWGRVLIQRVPRTVVAEPTAQAAGDAAPVATVATATDGPEERKTINVDLPQKLSRDLFALDASRYTRIVSTSDADIRPQGKSEPQASDVSQRPTAGNSGLALQATILGEHPCAVINGQVIRQGQKIKGFVLRKVLPQRVTLEMDGVEITLTK